MVLDIIAGIFVSIFFTAGVVFCGLVLMGKVKIKKVAIKLAEFIEKGGAFSEWWKSLDEKSIHVRILKSSLYSIALIIGILMVIDASPFLWNIDAFRESVSKLVFCLALSVGVFELFIGAAMIAEGLQGIWVLHSTKIKGIVTFLIFPLALIFGVLWEIPLSFSPPIEAVWRFFIVFGVILVISVIVIGAFFGIYIDAKHKNKHFFKNTEFHSFPEMLKMILKDIWGKKPKDKVQEVK